MRTRVLIYTAAGSIVAFLGALGALMYRVANSKPTTWFEL